MTTTGILIFDNVEDLDFVGPLEVFGCARATRPADRVLTLAAQGTPVHCAKGMTVIPTCTYDQAPALDILIVPGGQGTRQERHNPATLAFVQAQAPKVTWLTSVCSGALILASAGLLDGKRATTHWNVLDELRAYPEVRVEAEARYIRDGQTVTSAGISAGIDMALWLLGQVALPELARKVQRHMDYAPAPPYT